MNLNVERTCRDCGATPASRARFYLLGVGWVWRNLCDRCRPSAALWDIPNDESPAPPKRDGAQV